MGKIIGMIQSENEMMRKLLIDEREKEPHPT